MTSFLLLVIFLTASLSLVSYLYCWHDIRGGNPHIISIRQITGIMDRDIINAIFGAPQPGYYYQMKPPLTRELQKLWKWRYYQEVAADSVCILGSYYYLNAGGPDIYAAWFVLLAGLCQAISIWISVHLVRKWWHQIAEEMDGL